ncbi:hypothetical protein M422DRAFT_181541 [Sphaerobolus stellatus SS14]|uniref:Nudix hydrolase domain-containing protein n=1 Tax=Sphaerobolus stellatus (strain SS14) TaxID=990650 RepID=A0A0C9VBW5_SPHS4|nr:hypothetical protein M422DRAFT_181541 [Sphaerobolus stellatus SS14]
MRHGLGQTLRIGSRLRGLRVPQPRRFASAQQVDLAHFYNNHRTPEPVVYPNNHTTVLPLVLRSSNLVVGPIKGNHIVASRDEHGNVSLSGSEDVVPFVLSGGDGNLLGFVREQVSKAIVEDHQSQERSPWNVTFAEEAEAPCSIAFADWVNEMGTPERTKHILRLVQEWKEKEKFMDILRGWSDESYPVFNHVSKDKDNKNPAVAFSIERAALPLFGFPNFGSLLISYYTDAKTGEKMLWIPRRSRQKRTWPGKLDVTAGGGLELLDTPLSTICRECAEEASLDREYVVAFARPTGMISFPHRSPDGWILPGIYFTYDLPLPGDGSVMPAINKDDGEVEKFELMNVETVVQKLFDDEFKPNSALALVDFLIRHGHITPENDARYMDICLELKRDIRLPKWRPTDKSSSQDEGSSILTDILSIGLFAML